MLVIFSIGLQNSKSGVPVFNKTMEEAMKNDGIKFIRIKPKIFKCTRNSIFGYIERSLRSAYYNRMRYTTIVQYGNFYDLLMIPILRIFSKKLICIMHVGPMWKHWRKPLLSKISKMIIQKFCSKVLYISETQKNLLDGCNNKIKIPTMINKSFFHLSNKSSFSESNYYLYLGRISKDKGIDLLFDVYKKLFLNQKVKLKLAGGIENNRYKNKLNNYIKNNNLESKIQFLGEITSVSDKINLVDESIALIYPSSYDAFPLVPIESFSRGKPCLCSNISESKNFIVDENFLFNPKNKEEFEYRWNFLHKNLIPLKKEIDIIKNRSEQYNPENFIMNLKSLNVI